MVILRDVIYDVMPIMVQMVFTLDIRYVFIV